MKPQKSIKFTRSNIVYTSLIWTPLQPKYIALISRNSFHQSMILETDGIHCNQCFLSLKLTIYIDYDINKYFDLKL